MGFNRSSAFYVYLAALAGLVVALNTLDRPFDASHPDQIVEVLFLFIAVGALNLADVRLDRGHLTLGGVPMGAAIILTNPLHATIMALAIAIGQASRGARAVIGNATVYSLIACVAATVSAEFRTDDKLAFGSRVLVLLVLSLANLTLVAIGLSIQTGESVRTIARVNFTPSFFAAFAYMALASLLISYVLDGSLLGYFLATIVCVLSLALTDTIAGRRVRRVLESELSDADRHLFHSRAVEGVVHNLRNHMANALGYLREIDTRRLDPVDRESFETATGAANDAVTVLRSLSQGATPRVTYATDPIDLNELVTRGLGMARPRARAKEVQLAARETPDVVNVRADPLLMREVITNLLNNAIDAVGHGGRVEATTGRRGNGWPYFSIADNGPGISDDQRHRLFEPHFTTKEGGTGLGLFMSYGIVREHQGQLIYEGNRRGAVFTVTLPPFPG
jgi:signal transduction histidine kinase